MSVDDALDALKDAKLEKRDWREVSGIVNEILATRVWHGRFENMSAWLDAAGEHSGYSSSMLRRMVAVRDFLDRHKQEFGAPEILVDTSTRAPFAAMELLKRIHDIDKTKAKDVFTQILAGRVSHREVQAIYQKLTDTAASRFETERNARSAIGGQLNELLRLGPRFIEENLTKLTGDAQARSYFRKFRFAYASPTIVALRFKENGIAWIDAFDLRWSGRAWQRIRRKQMLSEVAFGATFFRSYWVVVDTREDVAKGIVRDVRALGLHSVGVVEVDTENPAKFKICQKPELSAQPNRQDHAVKEVLGQGIPDFATV